LFVIWGKADFTSLNAGVKLSGEVGMASKAI
jgi:hypothetical protein